METKACKGCGETKPLDQFWKSVGNTDGHYGKCSACKSKDIAKQKRHERLANRYNDYKQNSTRRKSRLDLKFDLTIKQFDNLTSQSCEYCGGFSPDKNFCGIDRVDDTLGYTLENCVPCCSTCNFMKRFWTREQFLAHITKIYAKSVSLSIGGSIPINEDIDPPMKP